MKKILVVIFTTLSLLTLAESSIPKISVQGIGSIEVKPDRVEINFSVVTEDENAEKAIEKNKAIMEKVKLKITELKINKNNIKTVDYSVNKISENYNTPNPIYKYQVRNSFLIEIEDIKNTENIVSKLQEVGINSISGMKFSSSKEKSIQSEVMVLAYKDAYEKANSVANSTGYVIEPLDLIYDYFPMRRNLSYNTNSLNIKSSKNTDLFIPEILNIEVNVKAVFQLKK
ncbi:MAG: SIMPL domain-containing protein [Fusobacteriaceae bacterium]